MSLDISTLYLVAMLVAIMLGGLLLFFWRREQMTALGWWGAAYLIGGVAIGGWALGAPYLLYPASLLLTALGFVACGLVWNAARVFHHRKTSWIGIGLGAIAWGVADSLLPAESSIRVIFGAAIVATYASLTASELAHERRKTLKSKWPAIVVPTLHGLVLMMPILLGDFMGAENATLTISSAWVAAFAIELVLYSVGTVFVIFILVSDRAMKAHKTAATVDPLTGLFNRRGFSDLTGRMIEREAKAGRPVTALVFDIDHFKSVNDRFGHPAGDEILKLFGSVLVHTLRGTDIVGRIGGEEFAALLPCTVEEAAIAAERVRVAYANAGVQIDATPLATSVSIGVAGSAAGMDLAALLSAADTALYRAKRSGRNRVELAVNEPLSLDEYRLAAQMRKHQPNIIHQFEKAGA